MFEKIYIHIWIDIDNIAWFVYSMFMFNFLNKTVLQKNKTLQKLFFACQSVSHKHLFSTDHNN